MQFEIGRRLGNERCLGCFYLATSVVPGAILHLYIVESRWQVKGIPAIYPMSRWYDAYCFRVRLFHPRTKDMSAVVRLATIVSLPVAPRLHPRATSGHGQVFNGPSRSPPYSHPMQCSAPPNLPRHDMSDCSSFTSRFKLFLGLSHQHIRLSMHHRGSV